MSLLRNPRTFAKVVDILGHNIYCYHAHLNVRLHHAAGVSLALSLSLSLSLYPSTQQAGRQQPTPAGWRPCEQGALVTCPD